MHLLRNNRFLFCFVVLLVLASIMVVRQIAAADSDHVKLREDFLLLDENGHAQLVAEHYQVLIQKLPDLSDRVLSEDLQRTAMLVQRDKPQPESLVWKYHVSVGNELRKRAEKRIGNAVLNQADR